MRLKSLHIYPIKSCAGFSPQSWALDPMGLAHDRRWMAVTSEGEPITQREHPRMALVRPEIRGSRLHVSGPGMKELVLPLEPVGGPEVGVTIWGWEGAGWASSPEGDAWFTNYLGVLARLVYCPRERAQTVDREYDPAGSVAGFADGFPLMLLGETSLEELNRRLAEPILMNRFRPNLVVGDTEPFAEDRWRTFRVGSVPMEVVKGCARCVLTTTDQATAVQGPEPLRTLATFRRRDGKVWFGQNVVHRTEGELRVGDTVEVMELKD